MTDIIFIVVLWLGLDICIKNHCSVESKSSPLGSFIGGCIVAAMMIALVRIPIYVILYGWTFPFKPTPTSEFWSGMFALAFWLSMAYWQIPGKITRYLFPHKSKRTPKNPYPRMPKIHGPTP